MDTIVFSKENNIYCYKELTNVPASQSNIFLRNGLIYKMIREPDEEILQEKEIKLELFSNFNEEYLLDLDSKVIDEDGLFRGFTSRYIKGKSLNEFRNLKDLLVQKKILLLISKDLERFHNLVGNPVFGDLHFNNIMLDNNLFPHFLDIDSYGIEEYKAENVPYACYVYCDYINSPIIKDQNTDKVNFFMSMIHFFFNKSIINLDEEEYDNMSELYPFLKDLKDVYYNIKYANKGIPKVPYIHELVRR